VELMYDPDTGRVRKIAVQACKHSSFVLACVQEAESLATLLNRSGATIVGTHSNIP
jgi:hypothetical protein